MLSTTIFPTSVLKAHLKNILSSLVSPGSTFLSIMTSGFISCSKYIKARYHWLIFSHFCRQNFYFGLVIDICIFVHFPTRVQTLLVSKRWLKEKVPHSLRWPRKQFYFKSRKSTFELHISSATTKCSNHRGLKPSDLSKTATKTLCIISFVFWLLHVEIRP